MKKIKRGRNNRFICRMIWTTVLLICISLNSGGQAVAASEGGQKKIKILTYADGSRYEGEVKKHQPQGVGTLYYTDGRRYEGEWKNGQMHGTGILYWPDGRHYEGDWTNGEMTGKGTLYYTDGSRYEGQWRNAYKHGKGVYYYADGRRYEGEWVNGQMQGTGILYWPDGRHYEGDWTNGEMTGKGTLYYTDGSRYEGQWKNACKSGKGTYYYADGSRYEGEWKNGMRNGTGTLYKADGTKIKGTWKNDVYSKKSKSEAKSKSETKNKSGTKTPASFSLPKLSGKGKDDILRVAKSQLGYEEDSKGRTVYADWADQSGKAWCSEFIAWCANKAGIPKSVIPAGISSDQYRRFYSQRGQYYIVRNNQNNSACGCKALSSKTISVKKIRPGDILLIDTNGRFSDGSDHTALVLSVSGNTVRTIDGNIGNKVTICTRTADQIHGVCRPLYGEK